MLLGSGNALTGTKIVVDFLGPPEGIIAVTGNEYVRTYMDGEARSVTNDVPVKVEDLVPLENQKSILEAYINESLQCGYQPQRPRAPAFEHEVGTSTLPLSLLKYITQTSACASAGNVDDSVEVVYITCAAVNHKESGQGLGQVRAKRNITLGGIRLFPIGGTILFENNGTSPGSIEKKQNLLLCHFREVRGRCDLRRDGVNVEY